MIKIKILFLLIFSLKNLFATDCPDWTITMDNGDRVSLSNTNCIASGGTAWIYEHPKDQTKVIKVFAQGFQEVFVDEINFSTILSRKGVKTLLPLEHTSLLIKDSSQLLDGSWYIVKKKLINTLAHYCE